MLNKDSWDKIHDYYDKIKLGLLMKFIFTTKSFPILSKLSLITYNMNK